MICPQCETDNIPGLEACRHCQFDLTAFDRPRAVDPVERAVMHEQVEVLTPNEPATIAPSATVREAIATMLAHNAGALLVVDDKSRLLGIFTERDLLKKVAGIHAHYADMPVERFMTKRPETVTTRDTINFVLQKMDGGGYRHVPVLHDGKPVSLVSVRDMLHYLTKLCNDA